MRKARVKRQTKETTIIANVKIEGSGRTRVRSGVGFFDHMLESFARHGLFDIEARITGDLHVDQHHVIEDTGITLGQAFDKALARREGIQRAGCFMYPMDEALVYVALDLSGRPYVRFDGTLRAKKIGEFETTVLEDFFRGFANALQATIHLKIMCGRSDHHKVEAIFKAFGKALKQACTLELRVRKNIPSTKGVL